MVKVRIWDLPTRLFHWALVLCVCSLLITGQMGGAAMTWHFRLGYAVFTLLLFRFVWGFVGGYWSRWWRLPLLSLRRYVRGHTTPRMLAGHNPLGSLSVIAMLCWLALQVATGLVSDDEIANAGPLSSLASSAMVSTATAWHKGLGKGLLILLVLSHVAALAWYQLRKHQALLPAMLHGDKSLPVAVPASRDGWLACLKAAVVLSLCVLAVRWVIALGGA